MGSKRDFYIVEPTGVPFREYLTVNRQALSEQNEFSVNVVFGEAPQLRQFAAPVVVR
jgi:Ca2+/H+ antiporter